MDTNLGLPKYTLVGHCGISDIVCEIGIPDIFGNYRAMDTINDLRIKLTKALWYQAKYEDSQKQIAKLQEKLTATNTTAIKYGHQLADCRDKLHRRNLQIADLKKKLTSIYQNIPDRKANPEEYGYWIASEYHRIMEK